MRTIGKSTLPLLACVAMLLMLLVQAAAQSLKEQIVGTWTVVSVTLEEGGTKREPFGPNPVGSFIFAPDGHFAANIIRPDRPKFASNNRVTGTPEENQAAVQGNISVFGTYTVNEADRSVDQHIIGSSFPNWDNTNQKRIAEINGDQMKWTNPTPAIRSGSAAVTILKRVSAASAASK